MQECRDEQGRLSRRRLLAGISMIGSTGLAGCPLWQSADRDGQTSGSPPHTTRTPSATIGSDTGTPTATPPPATSSAFLSRDEQSAIAQKVESNADPWSAAYRALAADAIEAHTVTPRSVVDDGAPAHARDNSNKFGTSSNRHDYFAAIKMGRWIRDLGLVFALTGHDQFAEQAIDFLHHWFVDPTTRMYPSGRNHGETYFSIELHITIPTMIYGAELLANHPYWEREYGDAESALRKWVEDYLEDLEQNRTEDSYTGTVRNNIYAWSIVDRAVAASYLDKTKALDRAFADWKEKAVTQVEADGGLKHEKHREDGLFYSMYGLKALLLTAEIARHYGEPLYEYGPDERSVLRSVCDYHVDYILNPARWTWGGGGEKFTHPDREEGASAYELAYSYWEDPAYLEVVKSAGRPVFERRILGYTTLTHGNRFELDV